MSKSGRIPDIKKRIIRSLPGLTCGCSLALERVAAAGESSEREEACRDRLVRGEGTWLAMGEVTWGTTPDTRGSFTCREKKANFIMLFIKVKTV